MLSIDKYFAEFYIARRNKGYKDWYLEDLIKKELAYQIGIPKEQLKVEDRLMYEMLSVKTTDDLVSMMYHVIVENSYSSTIVCLAADIHKGERVLQEPEAPNKNLPTNERVR